MESARARMAPRLGSRSSVFGHDRDTRNDASYRPTTLRPIPRAPSTDAAFVRDFWPLLEPAPGEPFRQIDRHLLRLTLERVFRVVTGAEPIGNGNFTKAVTRTLSANAGVDLNAPLGQFLRRAIEPATPVLFEAAATRESHLASDYHVHVISRATLLLRVATGASARLLSRAGIKPLQYRFWSEAFAEGHGICDIGALPADPADLWADVDDAIEDLIESVSAGGDRSFFSLLASTSSALEVLSGCERVPLWGLAA